MKKKICLAIPTMRQGGGAAKVFYYLQQYLNKQKYDIYVVVIQHESYHQLALSDHVTLVNLNCKQARYAVKGLYQAFKNIQPDVVLSTSGAVDIMCSLLKYRFNFKHVVRGISIPSKIKTSPIFSMLYKYSVRMADYFIAQSNAMLDSYVDVFGINRDKADIIYNPVKLPDRQLLDSKPSVFGDHQVNFLTVCRLSPEKQLDKMIRIFSLLSSNVHLNILGQGELDADLKQLVKQLELEDRVHFLGFSLDVAPYFRQADFYITTSSHEGCPNAVLEALSYGIPVFATFFDTIAEIVDDSNGMVSHASDLSGHADNLNQFTKRAFDKACIASQSEKKYSILSAVDRYEAVLDDL